jgi:hypothetical protein
MLHIVSSFLQNKIHKTTNITINHHTPISNNFMLGFFIFFVLFIYPIYKNKTQLKTAKRLIKKSQISMPKIISIFAKINKYTYNMIVF